MRTSSSHVSPVPERPSSQCGDLLGVAPAWRGEEVVDAVVADQVAEDHHDSGTVFEAGTRNTGQCSGSNRDLGQGIGIGAVVKQNPDQLPRLHLLEPRTPLPADDGKVTGDSGRSSWPGDRCGPGSAFRFAVVIG